MNILYLKYAVEVARTGSINKAAETLYIAQPNVSRAIKELESSLGISIFERTTKGMMLTYDGERFIRYAKSILSQIDEVENVFKNGENRKKKFSVSVPRAAYISRAFSEFVKKMPDAATEYTYRETNALRAVNNILNADYKLGVIRYAEIYDKYFKELFEEKGLESELVAEFQNVILMSKEHPLANEEKITSDMLMPYIEIANCDPYVPSIPMAEVRKDEIPDETERKIFVFERASQYDLLSENPKAFTRVSAVTEDILDRYGLVQKKCSDDKKTYRDVLIYRKNYRLTTLDKQFVTELCIAKRKYLK